MVGNSPIVDDSLLELRDVRTSVPDEVGVGFEMVLDCGHTVWMAGQPRTVAYCGQCLELLIRQIRDVQAHQEPRK
jgi:hypothetical protein